MGHVSSSLKKRHQRSSAAKDMQKDILIFHNDLTDSDNWVTARALRRAAAESPDLEVIWIIEPRQVSFGRPITNEQRAQCTELLKKYFPPDGGLKKTLLSGIEKSDLDGLGDLPEGEREILELAISPKPDPREDAVLHGRLVALDFLASLQSWVGGQVKVLLDVDSLDFTGSPVNLIAHHHEELVDRSLEQLQDYESILTKPYSERIPELRTWYKGCAQKVEQSLPEGSSVEDLDFKALCSTIENARNVKFFGGASLSLLQRLIERDNVGNVECILQAGTFDLNLNLFANQFNAALNIGAARYAFNHWQKFRKFIIVPTDTTRLISYSFPALCHGSPSLARRFLGFNCRFDAIDVASKKYTEKDLVGRSSAVPDLTAFLCAFSTVFPKIALISCDVEDLGGRLRLTRDRQNFSALELTEFQTLDDAAIEKMWTQLSVAGELLCLRR